MPYKDPEARKACAKRYRQSPKGRATAARIQKAFNQTAKGKARFERHEARRKGTRAAYEHARGLQRNYGITPAQYDAMFVAQKGLCAICESADRAGKRRLCVDHDHDTGKVRGLLCSRCNTAIGLLQHSSIYLNKARKYLVLN